MAEFKGEFAGEVGAHTVEKTYEGTKVVTRVIYADGEYMEFEAPRTMVRAVADLSDGEIQK